MENESVTISARVFTDKPTVDMHLGELRGVIPFLEKCRLRCAPYMTIDLRNPILEEPMAATEPATSGDLVIKPCGRAFFVYYVAMALVILGPRLNPEVGLPVWLGTVLGLIVLAAVIYQKYGTEYRVTSRGVVRVWRWPSPREQEIAWENLGEVLVLRGLTQTVLQVGNLAFRDKAGGSEMFWYGLLNPKDIKDMIDGKRP
jgi:hypothetical protein